MTSVVCQSSESRRRAVQTGRRAARLSIGRSVEGVRGEAPAKGLLIRNPEYLYHQFFFCFQNRHFFLECSWEVLGTFLGRSWNVPGMFLERSWNVPGALLGVRFWMFRVPATGPARQARTGELW